MTEPSNTGSDTNNSNRTPPIETDAVIIGAGPVGLFQIFELGLLEISAHVIDSLPVVGGQCVELYPDKPIYDIPAVPLCTGQQLTDNLLKQIEPFKPTFHLGQEVSTLLRREDGRFDLETSIGTRFITKTVFIAAGVGSFQARALKVEGIERFNDKQLFYRVRDPERFKGKNLVICGGGDSALDWALNLVEIAESVVMIHRRDEFRGTPASVAKVKQLCDTERMQLLIGQVTGFEGEQQLTHIKVTGSDGITRRLPLDHLLV
ncbi:MAG: NAD(P)/FAD-dependent oxidoreductase, partial [Herbaspirillum sp.]